MKGETGATTDPDIAAELATARVKELRSRKKGRVLDGIERRVTLKGYGSHHLKEKVTTGKTIERWMKQLEKRLRAAAAFFGDDRDVATISVADVQAFANHLSQLPGRRAKTMAPGSVRRYLNALSGLYRRAQPEGVVPPGYNPVAAMLDKPVATSHEARWLEVPDAALLLEAARLYVPAEPEKQEHGGVISAKPFRYMYELLATFLLTGGVARKCSVSKWTTCPSSGGPSPFDRTRGGT